jgi:predicted Rossmann fold nucleotide-binding protein DprA/Smf involved in DNA uptake
MAQVFDPCGIACPICNPHDEPDKRLAISEFGVCRARKSGRNLYCKACVRKKVTDSRKTVKEHKNRNNFSNGDPPIHSNGDGDCDEGSQIVWSTQNRLTPEEKVLASLKESPKTPKQVARDTKLSLEAVDIILTEMALHTREVKSEIQGDDRVYSLTGRVVIPATV